MEIELLKPIGYCNGVKKAIDLVNQVKEIEKDKNIYIFGSLAHNENLVKYLNDNNIKSLKYDIKELERLDSNSVVIFSAHGHSKIAEEILRNKLINYYDATCFNIERNNTLISYYHSSIPLIFIGKENHEETLTALSYSNVYLYDITNKIDYSKLDLNKEYIVINQTSLKEIDIIKAHNDLSKNIKKLNILDTSCGLIKQRLENLKKINKSTTIILIIGSKTSSNTIELYNQAKRLYPNKKVYMINSINDINFEINDLDYISISSGCSSDINDINEIVEYIKKQK